MPKSADQKLKLLYLIDYFSRNTDENNPATMNQIIDFLASQGIHAERKSIYSDIEALARLGHYIEFRRERPSGYYLSNREFELAELKLLVDAVQSSKFVSEKKTGILIGKLEKLTSKYEGHKLQRQVYTTGGVKTNNEQILYNIDPIHEAIASNRRITFNYCEWNVKKELVIKNNGKLYHVDPVALIWDNENYYLVAYDFEAEKIKHFRVDKIKNASVSDERRSRIPSVTKFDPSEYVKKHFGMYSGSEEMVTLGFENNMIGIIIDRFGHDVSIVKADEEHLNAKVKVNASDVFFGWISGFRGKIKILGNDTIKQQYKTFIEDIRQSLD